MTTAKEAWTKVNQRLLMAEIARVREILSRYTSKSKESAAYESDSLGSKTDLNPQAEAVSALDHASSVFHLSPFERDLLLLCAGMELDSRFPILCGIASGDPSRTYPTFSLALAAFPNAHWSALAPDSPLRYWRLIEVQSGPTLTLSPLRIDERILHFLTGISQMDERLTSIIEPIVTANALVESHASIAKRLVAAWSRCGQARALPVVQLCGIDGDGKRSIAASVCATVGLNLSVLSARDVPQSSADVETLVRLWEREAILNASALLLDCDDLDSADLPRTNSVVRFVERLRSALIVATRERRQFPHCHSMTFDVRKPTTDEQRLLWHRSLGGIADRVNGHLDTLLSHFSLSSVDIQSVCAAALGSASCSDFDARLLWDACRVQTRRSLDELAQRIDSAAQWDDLILPQPERQMLWNIVAHVRRRFTVYNRWGFGEKAARGLGITALFSGASGTGKTLAAEVMANELQLDLYRIDLSQVVNKYIGETEKNLRRVFDAAEDSGAILLFDEADALFGKRSEVRDSHDRYANIEVSYLLQRMEAYRGLAILTTNAKNALDPAFLRRIRFVVRFPFPDADQRADIWRRMFPKATPTDGLDVSRLARLNVVGGNIRNIAMYAAFLAADDGQPVRMQHLLRAARVEYAKLEKPLTEAEIGGWV